jgi:predicted regulator of Ras-like GTPase activity (Roadblock/LC7/MglB family)
MASSPSTEETVEERAQGPSHAAESLRWLLSRFVNEVPGVHSVAVVSSDGLLLCSSDTPPDEAGPDEAARNEAGPAEVAPNGGPPGGSSPGDAAAGADAEDARDADDAAAAADAEADVADAEDAEETPSGSSADLATVVSGIASLTEGAARLMDGGRVRQTAVAMANGSVFVMSISDGSLLGVHAAADCDMSVVAYHMAMFVGRAGHVLTPELRGELRRTIEEGGA